MEASPAPAWPASGSCSHLGLRASREGTPRNPRLGVCVMGAGGRREDGVPGLSWVSHLPCRGPGCKLSSVPLAGGGPRSWCQDVLGSTPPPPRSPPLPGRPPASHTSQVWATLGFRAACGPGLQMPGPSSVAVSRVVGFSSALLDLRLLEGGYPPRIPKMGFCPCNGLGGVR